MASTQPATPATIQTGKPDTATAMRGLLNKGTILVLVVLPLAGTLLAMRLLWRRAVDWSDIALMVGLYIPISMGITVGFHRYLTHRGFRTNVAIKTLLLVLGSLAIEGPALEWVANHRKHHAFSDRTGDPHSPADGFIHAHLGWLFTGLDVDAEIYARDLLADRVVIWVSRLFPFWVLLSLAIPWAIGGWHGLLWGGAVRIFLTHHVTWSVNSVCHTFGSRPFRTRDRSRNQWIVGLLALGEGWHNNHHAFPRSALHGLRWWQFDLSGLTIRLLERARLAWNVQRVSAADMKARLERGLVEIAATDVRARIESILQELHPGEIPARIAGKLQEIHPAEVKAQIESMLQELHPGEVRARLESKLQEIGDLLPRSVEEAAEGV